MLSQPLIYGWYFVSFNLTLNAYGFYKKQFDLKFKLSKATQSNNKRKSVRTLNDPISFWHSVYAVMTQKSAYLTDNSVMKIGNNRDKKKQLTVFVDITDCLQLLRSVLQNTWISNLRSLNQRSSQFDSDKNHASY